MKLKHLNQLNDKELFDYFHEYARYRSNAPIDSRYTIRVGSKLLFSKDTLDLREQFFAIVRGNLKEI